MLSLPSVPAPVLGVGQTFSFFSSIILKNYQSLLMKQSKTISESTGNMEQNFAPKTIPEFLISRQGCHEVGQAVRSGLPKTK